MATFISKKKIVVQPLVLIAIAIVAKPLGDSSLKLQTIVILWKRRSWITPHTLVTYPVLQKEGRSGSVLFWVISDAQYKFSTTAVDKL